MEIGNKIKKYREYINLSQEELADKVYVSRQTISNWENNKCYPDINSLKLLSNIFDVSLDKLIKEDIEEMKKIINEKDLKDYNILSIIYCIGFFVMILSFYPLFRFLRIYGIIIWCLIAIVTMYVAFKIERIYKRNDCRTYKEITAFIDGKSLSTKEQIEEKAKRPYQCILLAILSGVITLIILIIFGLLFGS